MTALRAAVVFMLVGACSAQWCYGGQLLKGGLSRDLQEKILHLHNTLRDKVAGGIITAQPMAENMKEMIWDQELATRAQNWANNCVFQHESHRTNRKGQLYGQNLSRRDKTWSSDEGEWEVLSKMIAEWFDEVYKPQDSLHFSQMVWANTHKIGCGYSEYKSNENVIALFVCNYFPSGNVIGTEPYKHGARSCEKHGLYASRSFRNLCEAKEEDGPDNLHSYQQHNTISPQQWTSGQYGYSTPEGAYPLQLLSSQSQRIVHYKPTAHPFAVIGYPPVGPLQVQSYQVPLGEYQTYTTRGVQPTDQLQWWGYQGQYSPSTLSQRQAQPKQTGRQFTMNGYPSAGPLQVKSYQVPLGEYQTYTIRGVQPTDQSQLWGYEDNYLPSTLSQRQAQPKPFYKPGTTFLQANYQGQLPYSQAAHSNPYQVNNVQVSPSEQPQSWNYQYLPIDQQSQNQASARLPYQYLMTDPINLLTQNTKRNGIQNLSKIPGYQITSTYQSYPVNTQNGWNQPANSNGYPWWYQTTPVQGEGQTIRSDGILGWPSGPSNTFWYGPTGPVRGNDKVQWFTVGNPVSVSYTPQTGYYGYVFQPSYTVPGPQTGYTTGLNSTFNTGFTYGNTVQPVSSTVLPPTFGLQGLLDPSLVAQYQTPYYPSRVSQPTGSPYTSFVTPSSDDNAARSLNDKPLNKLKKMRKQ